MRKIIVALLMACMPLTSAQAQIAISKLPAASALNGSDTVPVVQGTSTNRTTVQAIANTATAIASGATLGTPASITLTNGTGLPATGATSKLSGAGAISRSVQAKLADIIDARDYGATCTGGNDTAGIQAALNSASSGAEVHLPPGTCNYSTLTVPDGISLRGNGWQATALVTNNATGNTITFTGSGSHISHMHLAASVTRTSGAFVYSHNGVDASNLVVSGYFVGFDFEGTAPTVTTVQNAMIRDVQMFSPSVGAGSAVAIFENYSNAVVHNLIASGPDTGQQSDYGVVFKNGDTAFISDSNITHSGYALAIIPGNGENNYSFNSSNNDFDSAGQISGGVYANSCLIQTSGTGSVYQSHFSNTWCSLASGAGGALAQALGTGVIDGMHWTSGIFDGNGGSGFTVGANVKNWSVIGGEAAGNTGSGYYAPVATTNFAILGVRAGPAGGYGSNSSLGVNISSSGVTNYSIDANVTGNTGGGVFNATSGSSAPIQSSYQVSAQAYAVGSTAGVSCSGAPTSSFAVINGIVTHC